MYRAVVRNLLQKPATSKWDVQLVAARELEGVKSGIVDRLQAHEPSGAAIPVVDQVSRFELGVRHLGTPWSDRTSLAQNRGRILTHPLSHRSPAQDSQAKPSGTAFRDRFPRPEHFYVFLPLLKVVVKERLDLVEILVLGSRAGA